MTGMRRGSLERAWCKDDVAQLALFNLEPSVMQDEVEAAAVLPEAPGTENLGVLS